MYKSYFGTRGQVRFANSSEYYALLGYLAKSDGTTAIKWEHNEDQGAWGSEGRIHFNSTRLPPFGTLKFTAGNGSTYRRVNCNEFVGHIVHYHLFVKGKMQDTAVIRSTIPAAHLVDFDEGLYY